MGPFAAVLAGALALGSAGVDVTAPPRRIETATPATERRPLRLSAAVDPWASEPSPAGSLRFEARVDVQGADANAALARDFRGADLRWGPVGEGPPTPVELAARRPHGSPTADLLPALRWLLVEARAGR